MFFDEHPRFLDTGSVFTERHRLNLRHRAIIERNRDILAGARVLDIASHDGRWSFAALKAGAAHVTGIEARHDAVDAGVDHLFRHGGVRPEDVRDLVYGAIFTRGPADLKSTAVFVGGSDATAGEALLKAATDAFFGPMRVSVMLDSNGCNTTAAAAVARLAGVLDLKGARVVILADGSVVEEGEPRRVLEAPQHEETRKLLQVERAKIVK